MFSPSVSHLLCAPPCITAFLSFSLIFLLSLSCLFLSLVFSQSLTAVHSTKYPILSSSFLFSQCLSPFLFLSFFYFSLHLFSSSVSILFFRYFYPSIPLTQAQAVRNPSETWSRLQWFIHFLILIPPISPYIHPYVLQPRCVSLIDLLQALFLCLCSCFSSASLSVFPHPCSIGPSFPHSFC